MTDPVKANVLLNGTQLCATNEQHRRASRITWLLVVVWAWPLLVNAQQPFATDDADVTPRGVVHVEVFNEHDWLQASQQPHLRQNTLNMRVNYGLTDRLEADVDAPLLTIFNAATTTPERPFGIGDTNCGMKYNIREEQHGAQGFAIAVAAYIEVPTGDTSTSLGSGATDVWVYGVAEEALTDKSTLRLNAGYLFVGNTSTGVVGITATTHGHIATMGGSLIRTLSETWQIGVEVTAAATSNVDLNRGQLQFTLGGSYAVRPHLSLDFGFIAGHFVASPRAGVQVGVSIDLSRAAQELVTRNGGV